MKIALYIEDGLEQIVLTPETETEKSILAKLHDGDRDLNLKRGSFFKCQGGWIRYAQPWRGQYDIKDKDDDSTIVMLTPKQETIAVEPIAETWLQNDRDVA